MIELFGLGLVGTIALLSGVGVWFILGLIFGINGIVEKNKKYRWAVRDGKSVPGIFVRFLSYSFALLLGITFAPILVIFWFGKRAGKKQASG